MTGSVANVGGTYYLFYTGHTDGPMEYKEKIMVAVGDSPLTFTKRADWELIPPDELGQKRDFRDPQAYYDPESGYITLTVTAAQDGVARILKFTLSADLQNVIYDGIIFTAIPGTSPIRGRTTPFGSPAPTHHMAPMVRQNP